MVNDAKANLKLITFDKKWKRITSSILLICFTINPLSINIEACTTFFLRNGNHMVCGRNFDYSLGEYLIFVNRRNVIKRAFSYPDEIVDFPASWTSKYGSISFNMNGHNAPTDGMNEAGLIVTSLVLVESEYPIIEGKPSVSLDQWIQYALDNYATVDEVIDACSKINIRYLPQDNVRLHFLVTDGNGKNAVIEFLDGQLIATTGEDLRKKVIANSSYGLSIEYYNQGGNPNLPATASLNRFYNAAVMVDAYNNQDVIDYSYSIMDATAQRHTQRRIVYDITNMRVYLKSLVNEQLRFFDFSAFDFSCQQQQLVYQETPGDQGNIRDKFISYTTEINQFLTETSWQFLQKNYTQEELDDFAEYPETFECFYVDAGSDIEICQNYTEVYGNNLPNYSGMWTVVSGNAIFDNLLEANTYARYLHPGLNVLRWTLHGEYNNHYDDLLITSNYVKAIAGMDSIVETNSIYLYGNEPNNGTGEWTLLEGSVVFNNPNQHNTLASDLNLGVNKFVWEIINQNCSDKDTIEIIYDLKSLISSFDKSGLSFSIYPNPTQQYLYLEYLFPDNKELEVSLFDAKGKLKYSKFIRHSVGGLTERIDVRPFPKGDYIIMVRAKNFKKALKFIKL